MTIIEQIKAEIERRMKILREDEVVHQNCTSDFLEGKIYGYEEVLSFLSEFESEKPNKYEGLDEAAEEAATEVYTYTFQGMDDLIGLFKAGAEWQKEQMMKESVEKTVCLAPSLVGPKMFTMSIELSADELKGFYFGDKVRIIIVKED